jgi:hypothetical protein
VSDPPPPRKRPLADVLEDIVAEDVLREQRGMTPEQIQADLREMGYDADALGKKLDGVLQAAVKPRRPLADVLEDVCFEDALLEQRAMTPEQIRADVAQFDADRGALEAAIAEAMSMAGLPAFDAAPNARAEVQKGAAGKVVDLKAARDKRIAKTRWAWFLPAAAGFAALGGGITQQVATTMPEPTVVYPTNTLPPSLHEIAEIVRGRALRQCKLEYWTECEDTLDQAKAIDPDGENEPAVMDARDYIDGWRRGAPPGAEVEHFRDLSKPGLGPGERRLQRR